MHTLTQTLYDMLHESEGFLSVLLTIISPVTRTDPHMLFF